MSHGHKIKRGFQDKRWVFIKECLKKNYFYIYFKEELSNNDDGK